MKKKGVKPRRAAQNTTRQMLSSISDSVREQHQHNDSRVIERRISVLKFEQEAADEHLAALRESMAAVRATREALRAQIEGLLRVLEARQ